MATMVGIGAKEGSGGKGNRTLNFDGDAMADQSKVRLHSKGSQRAKGSAYIPGIHLVEILLLLQVSFEALLCDSLLGAARVEREWPRDRYRPAIISMGY